jgi:AraC family transcriptional regulator of adaptative response / DNA-3-methyladenine glycosylase II
MSMDTTHCYTALASRDARFDGRFFTGVVTTGVYCRPVCPAPTPKPENCRFFPSAAAAEQAGFRPCLRCHPESSPGTPAWQGAAALVSRALRLIAAGALDGAGVDSLAERLGVGARHLRRLFTRHLGASPVAVAQTRRIQVAKQLLDETRLPVIRVAEAAGFQSLRRFNTAVRNTYGRPPRDLRRQAETGAAAAPASLDLTLAYRPPLHWAAMVDYLKARAIPGVEVVTRASYQRSFLADNLSGVLEVQPDEGRNALRLRFPAKFAHHVTAFVVLVRQIFDLEADPAVIETDLARDPALAALIARRPGLRVPGAWNGFELAVRAILGQQVTVRAASTMAGRIARILGYPVWEPTPDGPQRLFPKPSLLADADLTVLGLTRERAGTIRRLARAVCDGELRLDPVAGPAEVADRLRRIRGIGDWTVQYILMRVVREPDAFPAADLGLRRAAASGPDPLPARRLLERAETWRPWRAYAAMHLWHGGPGCLG